ncbi:hypothetical protein BPJM79_20423 [Bacillus pumilus]
MHMLCIILYTLHTKEIGVKICDYHGRYRTGRTSRLKTNS